MADEKTTPEAEPVTVSTPSKQEHGAQVRITGDARAAARGGLAGDLMGNLLAKRALEADGTVADGYSADGTSVTGKRQPDDDLAEEQDTPTGKPETTRVEVEDEEARQEIQAPDGLRGTSMTPPAEPKPKAKK